VIGLGCREPGLGDGVMGTLSRIVLLGLFGLLLLGTTPTSAGAQVIGIVTGLLGPVSVRHSGGVGPEPLALHNEIREGDVLRTGPGARLKVTLRDASVLSLGADTQLKLDHLAQSALAGEPRSFFTLAGGFLRTVVGRLRPGSIFEIRSPSMIAAVRGTNWIESYSAGTTEIFVAEGLVLATSTADRSDWALLAAGEGASFITGGPHTPVVRWGQEKINRYVEATRVP
jgi:FecR protein